MFERAGSESRGHTVTEGGSVLVGAAFSVADEVGPLGFGFGWLEVTVDEFDLSVSE